MQSLQHTMSSASGTSINAIHKTKNRQESRPKHHQQRPNHSKCGFCGRKSHTTEEHRDFRPICDICKKPGHKTEEHRESRPRRHRKRSFSNGRRNRSHSYPRYNNVHMAVQHAPTEAFEQLTLESITVHSMAQHAKTTQAFATLQVYKPEQRKMINIKCKVDTGAQANVMPLSYLRQLYPEKLTPEGYPNDQLCEQTNTLLTAYGGARIPHIGKTTIPCG